MPRRWSVLFKLVSSLRCLRGAIFCGAIDHVSRFFVHLAFHRATDPPHEPELAQARDIVSTRPHREQGLAQRGRVLKHAVPSLARFEIRRCTKACYPHQGLITNGR